MTLCCIRQLNPYKAHLRALTMSSHIHIYVQIYKLINASVNHKHVNLIELHNGTVSLKMGILSLLSKYILKKEKFRKIKKNNYLFFNISLHKQFYLLSHLLTHWLYWLLHHTYTYIHIHAVLSRPVSQWTGNVNAANRQIMQTNAVHNNRLCMCNCAFALKCLIAEERNQLFPRDTKLCMKR